MQHKLLDNVLGPSNGSLIGTLTETWTGDSGEWNKGECLFALSEHIETIWHTSPTWGIRVRHNLANDEWSWENVLVKAVSHFSQSQLATFKWVFKCWEMNTEFFSYIYIHIGLWSKNIIFKRLVIINSWMIPINCIVCILYE